MKAAASLAEYLADPFDRYLAGRTWAHFFHDRTLCGLVLWGRPDVGQVREMVAAIDSEAHAGMHQSIIDVRRLTGVDGAAFEEFSRSMGARGATLGPGVTHHAIVRPEGFVGAAVSGFYAVTPTQFPDRIRLFDSIGAALDWMGRAEVPLEKAIDAIAAAATAVPDALRAVRGQLATLRRAISLREAAQAAGVSPRTLQAQLLAAGTSLRAEINAARVQWAQALLADTDHKITSIALEVGCASLQHFSTLFRKATGMAPSEWRDRAHRRA